MIENEDFARECLIRDLYAARLGEFRPAEKLLGTEYTFPGSRVRADMRTVDASNTVRVWEFKIIAGYDGLGQILTYLAQERLAANFGRQVEGVLAAFSVQPEINTAVTVLNLGIELVTIPPKLRLAGGVPSVDVAWPVPEIPNLAGLMPAQRKD